MTTYAQYHDPIWELEEQVAKIMNKIRYGPYLTSSDLITEYPMSYQNLSKNFGSTDNILFYILDNYIFSTILQSLQYDLSAVSDSKSNNILHYAIFRGNVGHISAILNYARNNSYILHKLVNHRNIFGTNPLGMNFISFKCQYTLALQIQIAGIFANVFEYKINDYLNNREFMDFLSDTNLIESNTGGTNLLHKVVLTAKHLSFQELQTNQFYFDMFFLNLIQRLQRDIHFNPYYPMVHPSVQRISTNDLLNQNFRSGEVKTYIGYFLHRLFTTYENLRGCDDSGDSDDERAPANFYKSTLKDLNRTVKNCLKDNLNNDYGLRTFEKYAEQYCLIPNKFNETVKQFTQMQNIPSEINDNNFDVHGLGEILKSIVVPLFHGVPFMDSEYTNVQRREIARRILKINQKLLSKFTIDHNNETHVDPLTEEEKVLIGIHSQTATANVGVQSLYELVVALPSTLENLDDVDDKLLHFFRTNNHPKTVKTAMHHYALKFSETKSVERFWSSYGEAPSYDFIKYRFPTIATSKAPDHALRFAIGRNAAALKNDSLLMRPQYINGYPKHRIAGLVYVTLHKLSDLISRRNDRTVIDVNLSLKKEEIINGSRSNTTMHQNECTFFGRINSDSVIAVIPIIYPHEQFTFKFDPEYHEEIFGLDRRIRSIFDFSRVKIFNKPETNPDIIERDFGRYTKSSGFGSVMVPSIVNLANGLVTAYAKNKNLLLFTIDDSNKLKLYPVHFDKVPHCQGFSKAQQISRDTTGKVIPANRMWESIIREAKKNNIVHSPFRKDKGFKRTSRFNPYSRDPTGRNVRGRLY